MAQHKAPTSVTIASTREESDFQRFIDRHWKTGLIAFLGIAGFILLSQWRRQESREATDASWDRLGEEVTFAFEVQASSPEAVARLAAELEDDQAGPWAKGIEVGSRIQGGDYAGAQSALDELAQTWPDHPLIQHAWTIDEEGNRATLPELLRSRSGAIEAWEAAHPRLFGNPPLPEGSPRVRLQTGLGDIVVGLFADRAPKHVENFLKLCGEGFYDGTRFHRVMKGFMIQGGDPNSRDGDPATWGQGGVDYTLVPEFSDVFHFRYVLAAAKKPGETESSGAQFYITTGEPHHLDGQHTVFGVVLEGQSVVDSIETGVVDQDRPVDPVVIDATEVL